MPCKTVPMLQSVHQVYEINTSLWLSQVQKIWVFAPINVSYCIYWLIKSPRTRLPFFSQLDPLQIYKCNALTYLNSTRAPKGRHTPGKNVCSRLAGHGPAAVASGGGSPGPAGSSWPPLETCVARVNEVNKPRSKQDDKRREWAL